MPRKSLKKSIAKQPPTSAPHPKPAHLINEIFEIEALGFTKETREKLSIKYKAAFRQLDFVRELERKTQPHVQAIQKLHERFYCLSHDEHYSYFQKSIKIINLFYFMIIHFENNDILGKDNYHRKLKTLWEKLNAEHTKLHNLITLNGCKFTRAQNEYFSTLFEASKVIFSELEPKFREFLSFIQNKWEPIPDPADPESLIIYAQTPSEIRKSYTLTKDELFKWHKFFIVIEYCNCSKAIFDGDHELATGFYQKASTLLAYLKSNYKSFLTKRKLSLSEYNFYEKDQSCQLEDLESQLICKKPNPPSSVSHFSLDMMLQQLGCPISDLSEPNDFSTHTDLIRIDIVETSKNILENACLVEASKTISPSAALLIAAHQEVFRTIFGNLILDTIVQKLKNVDKLSEQNFSEQSFCDKARYEIEKAKVEIVEHHAMFINVLHFVYFHLLPNPVSQAKNLDALLLYWDHLTSSFKKMCSLYINSQLSLSEFGSYHDKIHNYYSFIEEGKQILVHPDSSFSIQITAVEVELFYSHFLLLHTSSQHVIKASHYQRNSRKCIEFLKQNFSQEENAEEKIIALEKQLHNIEKSQSSPITLFEQFFEKLYHFKPNFDTHLNLTFNFMNNHDHNSLFFNMDTFCYELTIEKITRYLEKMEKHPDTQTMLLMPTFYLTRLLLEKIPIFSVYSLPSFLEATHQLCEKWSAFFATCPENLHRQMILALFKYIENRLAALKAVPLPPLPPQSIRLQKTVDDIWLCDMESVFASNIHMLESMVAELTETKETLLEKKEIEYESQLPPTFEEQLKTLTTQIETFKTRPIIERFDPYPIAELERTKALLLALRQFSARSPDLISILRATMKLLLQWIQFTTVEEKYTNDKLKQLTGHFHSLFNLCQQCYSSLSKIEAHKETEVEPRTIKEFPSVAELMRDFSQLDKIKEKQKEKQKEKEKEKGKKKEKKKEKISSSPPDNPSSSYKLPRSNAVFCHPINIEEVPNLQPWITVEKKIRKSSTDLRKDKNILKEHLPWYFKPIIFNKKATPYQNRKDHTSLKKEIKSPVKENSVKNLTIQTQKLSFLPPIITQEVPAKRESSPKLVIDHDTMIIATVAVPEDLKEKMGKIEKTGYSIFIGGGWVRFMAAPEELREPFPPHDVDLMTNAPIEVIEKLFPHDGYSREIIVNETRINLFVFHDKITQIFCSSSKTLKEEASKRDITRNGLFCDSEGNVIDVSNYSATFASPYLIPIGDVMKRIPQDYSLILRYLRLKNQCSLLLDPSLAEAIKDFASALHLNISWGVLMSNFNALFMRFESLAYLNLNDLWDFNVISYFYGNHEAFIEDCMYDFWCDKIYAFHQRKGNDPKHRDDVNEIASWFLLPLLLSHMKYQNHDDAILATVNEIQQKFKFDASRVSESLKRYLGTIYSDYALFYAQPAVMTPQYSREKSGIMIAQSTVPTALDGEHFFQSKLS